MGHDTGVLPVLRWTECSENAYKAHDYERWQTLGRRSAYHRLGIAQGMLALPTLCDATVAGGIPVRRFLPSSFCESPCLLGSEREQKGGREHLAWPSKGAGAPGPPSCRSIN